MSNQAARRANEHPAQGNALGGSNGATNALKGQKPLIINAFAPSGRTLHIKQRPRAVPWAMCLPALQAVYSYNL